MEGDARLAYEIIRRDLTETTRKCDFCPKYLTSLKAYILKDSETSELLYAGPTCAKNNAGVVTLIGTPDLTKFTLAANEGAAGGAGGHGDGTSNEDNPEKKALEYLVLREEKLVNEMSCSYQVLNNYYEKSKTKKLSEDEITHINNIAAKAPENLRPASLQRIYNYLFWLDVAIEKLSDEKSDFLKNVRKTIVQTKKITDGQQTAINRWLVNIDGIPQLK